MAETVRHTPVFPLPIGFPPTFSSSHFAVGPSTPSAFAFLKHHLNPRVLFPLYPLPVVQRSDAIFADRASHWSTVF